MKIKLILFWLSLTFAFSACGNSSKVIEGEVKTTTTEEMVEEVVKEKEPEMVEGIEEEGVAYEGYAFIYNDIVIEMDVEAAPIIDELGEPNTYFEAASCAFEGIDKMYTYNSFEIDTYPLDDVDYISSVIFKDDSVATAEGIEIGDSIDKVTEAYGNQGINESGMLVYEKDKVKLCFIIQDNAVASVEYRSTVLDE